MLLQPFASTDGITQMVKAAEQHAEELSALSGEHALLLSGCIETAWLQQTSLALMLDGDDMPICSAAAVRCGPLQVPALWPCSVTTRCCRSSSCLSGSLCTSEAQWC